jgi:hypothetical protein
MTIIQKATATTSAIVLMSFLGVSASFAQSQPTPNPAPAPGTRAEQPLPEQRAEQPATAQDAKNTLKGELVSVDTATKMLTVKTAAGVEEKVRYDDSTKVTGAKDGVAGLANSDDSDVTITFSGSGATRVATEIKVDKDN